MVKQWYLQQGLSERKGEKLLYHIVGKEYLQNLKQCQTNFRAVVENHLEIEEAIQSQIHLAGIKHRSCYDDIETRIYEFCERNIAPRKVKDLESCMDETLRKWG